MTINDFYGHPVVVSWLELGLAAIGANDHFFITNFK